jgi:tetratricopeptide (TPR) repeat protein
MVLSEQSRRCALVLILAALSVAGGPLAAQDLPLKLNYPQSGPYVCPASDDAARPSIEAVAQASQLGSDASQADILGDLERARDLLARAVQVDPTSASLAYRYARVLETLGEREAAIAQLCRVVDLAANAEEFSDAPGRINALHAAGQPDLTDEAIEAFRLGVFQAGNGQLERAAASLATATTEAPQWADAAYNRGAVLSRLGQREEAADELRRYLELNPDAPDVIAVSRHIGELQGSGARPSAGATLTLGVLVPGMGQIYSGRPQAGLAVLALAGGAAAAGFLVREVTTQCLVNETTFTECPAGQVYLEESDRPYLMPALGVAAAATLIGAVEAFVKARRPSGATRREAEPATARLDLPTVSAHGRRVDLNVLRIRF